jgi:phage shock protein A
MQRKTVNFKKQPSKDSPSNRDLIQTLLSEMQLLVNVVQDMDHKLKKLSEEVESLKKEKEDSEIKIEKSSGWFY